MVYTCPTGIPSSRKSMGIGRGGSDGGAGGDDDDDEASLQTFA